MAGGAAGSPQEPDGQYSSVVSSFLSAPAAKMVDYFRIFCPRAVRFRVHLQPGYRSGGAGSPACLYPGRSRSGNPARRHSSLHEFPDNLLRGGSHGCSKCLRRPQGEERAGDAHSRRQQHPETYFGMCFAACNTCFLAMNEYPKAKPSKE